MKTHRTFTIAGLLTTGGILVSCIFPTDSCGCSPVVPRGVVIGDVTSSTGPVAGAVVRVASVRAGDTTFMVERDSAEADGTYLVRFQQYYTDATWFVQADPHFSSALAPNAVAFVPRFGRGIDLDTVRVDITLPPR